MMMFYHTKQNIITGLLLLFFSTSSSQPRKRCAQGHWWANVPGVGMKCSPCPLGYACADGIELLKCDPETTRSSVGLGAINCCMANQTCGDPRTAVGSDCKCHSIQCEVGLALVQTSNGFECLDLRTLYGCEFLCPYGGSSSRGFVQNTECQCVQWRECSGGQVWKKNRHYFECINPK